ncbi:4-hydroxyphenylpyruvate dioxygenase [Rugamonas sp. CCM 8940]|uniref:4-hydroxyphenylpyruvate dioxygenase n=1 Tax=Rugamonas sp. CCM 8940 TaxID=2765359 RepID=UPI0018F2A38A|nr:4-hydroxyphenylpyruvate dioxygenase [Rugamonas sp. CCM 8940]MBJ7310121.1 4-hydroxyphenylpyruvate dioxygenase [Rugamonas sp. CCM 8940]
MQFQPWDNPMGTDGFEFVEYAAPDPKALGALFERMGFCAIARHRHKDVTLYRQGEINFIINAERDSFAQRFARQHGPSVCAIAIRVADAAFTYRRALELGAWGFDNQTGPMELNIPAIKGVGDSLLYFVDRWRGKGAGAAGAAAPLPGAIGDISIYDVDFVAIPGAVANPLGNGLTYIDHLTHNVHRGRMKEWAGFYESLFNFREVRYFDIEGKLTGLKSKAMTSPCGKIRIPINESSDDKSQIAEYLDQYHGEGIQHIALGSDDVYASVQKLRDGGIVFQDTIETYYELVERRLPHHGENLAEMRRLRILLDGHSSEHERELLLQIFTQNVIGPIFFEIIQRKGDQGFGEGNFRALFESIELDQIKRGVLRDPANTPA